MAFMDNAVKPQNPEEVKPDVAEEDDGRKQSPAALRDNFKKKGVAIRG